MIHQTSIELEPASRLRIIAAFYIDLLAHSALVYVLEALLGFRGYHWHITLGVWAIVELITAFVFPISIGYYALGISKTDEGLVVDSAQKRRASRVFLFFAIALIYEGHRTFANGIVDYTAYYFFSNPVPRPASQVMFGILGLAFLAAGVLMCRVRHPAPFLTLAVWAFMFLNDATSRPLQIQLAEEVKQRKEQERGRKVPMQSQTVADIALYASAGMFLIYAMLFYARRKQFAESDVDSPQAPAL